MPPTAPRSTRPGPRRWWLPVVAAVAGCLLLAACNPAGTARAQAGSCQVGVVGDSLSVGSESQGDLAERFAAEDCAVTAIDAVIGRSTAAGADVVEAWAAAGSLPSILVVELGTNDCSASTFEASARRILAAAGPDRPVIWVTTWRTACDDAINGVIGQLQVEDGGHRLWVLDHHDWIADHPDLLAGDGIHLTSAGYAAYAERLATSVGEPSRFDAALGRAEQAIRSVVGQLV